MKNTVVLLLLFLFLLGAAVEAEATSGDGTIYYEKNLSVGEITRLVRVIEVDLTHPELILDVAISHNRLGGAESLLEMVRREEAVAAVNANFFHAYSDLDPVGTLAKQGEIYLLEGGQVSAGITIDNRIIFTEQPTLVRGKVENGAVLGTWNAWYINSLHVNQYGLALYTPRRGEKIHIEVPGRAVIVDQNVVQHFVDTPATVEIPPQGMVIFCGAKAVEDYTGYLDRRFVPGRTVTFSYELRDESGEDAGFWELTEHVITAGPRLLRHGAVDLKGLLDYEKKISTQRAQRSALGVTGNEKMLMVTVSSVTVRELAEMMKLLGAEEAINLDGGASSALFYRGEVKTAPGRNLSTLLVVKNRPAPNVQVEIDGLALTLDVPPILKDGRVMVPMRAIFEALGAEISWDGENLRVSGSKGYTSVALTIGETTAQLNGNAVELDVPAEIADGRTLVPTRFVAESLGSRVHWDPARRLVQIITR